MKCIHCDNLVNGECLSEGMSVEDEFGWCVFFTRTLSDMKEIQKQFIPAKRWIFITLDDDGVHTTVSDDHTNPPHIADLINVGLMHGSLVQFNNSLYSGVHTKYKSQNDD